MEYVEVARASSERGEVVLRQRRDPDAPAGSPTVLELQGQRRLRHGHPGDRERDRARPCGARAARDAAARSSSAASGWGSPCTRSSPTPAVEHVVVAELEEPLVTWFRDGTIPHGPTYLADGRVQLSVADGPAGGRRGGARLLRPGAARRRQRSRLPRPRGQRPDLRGRRSSARSAECCARPEPSWSGRRAESDRLDAALREAFGDCRTEPCPVLLQGREETYWLYTARNTERPRAPRNHRGETTMADQDRGETRIEHDSMGEVAVPKDALWRAQTQRAVENFPISGARLEADHVQALALVKAAAARVNARLGVLDEELAEAIATAAEEVAGGAHADAFPVDVFQTGSGTSSNMNMNEVLATLATRAGAEAHPNDHVNASQSSNDVFPTSIHVAAVRSVQQHLLPGARPPRRGARAQGGGVRRRGQGRPHPPHGRHAGDARPGVRRLRRDRPARDRAGPLVAAAGGGAAARRHGRRHRDQHAARLLGRRHRGARVDDRAAVHRGRRPLRGPGRPRRARGALRPAAHLRGRPDQDLQRPAVDVARARSPASPRSTCPTSSRGRASCPAR